MMYLQSLVLVVRNTPAHMEVIADPRFLVEHVSKGLSLLAKVLPVIKPTGPKAYCGRWTC